MNTTCNKFSFLPLFSYLGVCQEDGEFLPDTANCSVFYECEGPIPYALACPMNTCWNKGEGLCDFTCDCQC